MKNKTINELTSLENPRLTDTLPIWDGTEGKTKKVSLAKIPANVITPVDSLPESPNILDRVYRYNNKYYVGNESAQTLTEIAPKADIPTVVDTVEDGNMNPVTSNAVYDALNSLAKSINLVSVNNSSIYHDKSRIIGGVVTICAAIVVSSGNHLVKENAVANVPNYGTSSIGYILPCIYRNTENGSEEPGYAIIYTNGDLKPYYTKTEYNEIRINASYSSKI